MATMNRKRVIKRIEGEASEQYLRKQADDLIAAFDRERADASRKTFEAERRAGNKRRARGRA